jgi:NAD(P)-dependent dehydrogenase (short-subunit alcohol dehydrogenase family)
MSLSKTMPQVLAGKRAIVTGGACGMGLEHARHLARLGADIAIFDIDLEVSKRWNHKLNGQTVVDDIRGLGVNCIAIQVDLTSAAATQAAVDQIVTQWPEIDILVNNAGGAVTPFERSSPTLITDEDTHRVVNVNLMSTVNCCRAVAPYLRRPGASIINIATTNAEMEVSGGKLALYAASKAAVIRYTRSLAVELGPEGIRANALSPGYVETPRIVAQAAARPGLSGNDLSGKIPLRRSGRSEDVSRVVEFLAGPMSGYVTGNNIRVSGGMELV